MQDREKRIDNWVRCPYCGHKLFKLKQTENETEITIEIKCHSCKEIYELTLH